MGWHFMCISHHHKCFDFDKCYLTLIDCFGCGWVRPVLQPFNIKCFDQLRNRVFFPVCLFIQKRTKKLLTKNQAIQIQLIGCFEDEPIPKFIQFLNHIPIVQKLHCYIKKAQWKRPKNTPLTHHDGLVFFSLLSKSSIFGSKKKTLVQHINTKTHLCNKYIAIKLNFVRTFSIQLKTGISQLSMEFIPLPNWFSE